MKKILYLTDLYYEAKGRKYYEEDICITKQLKDVFDVALCNPQNSQSFEDDADLIVFRNTGAVSGYRDVYRDFTQRVKSRKLNTFNEFRGKADMCGKQYLVDLTAQDYPVIPTIDRKADIGVLPEADMYVIKPKDGADSIGLEFLSHEVLQKRDFKDGVTIIEPAVDFLYEVSFYFINDRFQYAMYAPDKSVRWELERYEPSAADLAFAESFIKWNDINYGIQRVDACRTKDGGLLLVELEDLNPYLSILNLDEETRSRFIGELISTFRIMTE